MGRKREQEQGAHSDFAARFIKAMTESGLMTGNYKVIGGKLGVSGATVGYWVNGDKLPSMDRAITIAFKTGFCVEWLLTGRGPEKPGQSVAPEAHQDMQEILKLQQEIGPEAWRHIVEGLRSVARGKRE